MFSTQRRSSWIFYGKTCEWSEHRHLYHLHSLLGVEHKVHPHTVKHLKVPEDWNWRGFYYRDTEHCLLSHEALTLFSDWLTCIGLLQIIFVCTVWTHKLIWLWIRNECIKPAVLQKNSIQICTIYKHIQNVYVMFKNCKQNENKHLWYKDIDIKNVTFTFFLYTITHIFMIIQAGRTNDILITDYKYHKQCSLLYFLWTFCSHISMISELVQSLKANIVQMSLRTLCECVTKQ